jgi:hypothetical protein
MLLHDMLVDPVVVLLVEHIEDLVQLPGIKSLKLITFIS